MMKVIPSALLLASGGIVVAQDDPTPVLISSTGVDDSGGSDPIPTQISVDPDANPSMPELFEDFDMSDFFGGAGDGGGADMAGDFGDLLSGLFGGGDAGSTTGAGAGDGDAQDMMFGDLSDMISGMFGGGSSDPDGQGPNILEELIGAGLSTSSGPFNLECPSTCENPDLCQGDLMSLMMGGTDILQAMCDTGCIPTIVLDACDPDATAAANAAFIASTGVCDFVNCCAVTEQEDTEDAAAVAVSSTRAKFDECQEKLPEMADLFASTFPQDPSTTTTSDFGGFDMDFDMSGFQDMIEEIVDGFEEVLDQFGDSNMLSDMFSSIFDSSSIPAFCAVESCSDPPTGFCECFSGDLAQCSTEVISEACTTNAFSTCAPEGFTEFCSNECDQSNGSDILHMCAMCNVVTCCSKDNSEMEGCLSEAFEDHSQAIMADVDAIFSEFEDFLGGMDFEGMLTEILGDMESMQWCPDDKTCPLGPQFCEMANGGPSAVDSGVAISPRMDLQSFDLGSMGMDLDKMCADDMIFSCGPVDMKARCDSVCGDDDTDGFMKEAFCRVCGLAACCENGEDKTFSECSLAAYESTDISATPDQDSTSEPPKEEPEVTNETNTASDGAPEVDFSEASPEGGTEPEAADLTPSQITALENSRFEQENSGMTFSSVSFFTAMISTGLVLALY
mmetsp:Transcript_19799/g.29594  ORF Transcript_19799/g.29594 Transcript_19799/m.29594 type:complete len:675 (-) Transcript_19799:86-2110(-)